MNEKILESVYSCINCFIKKKNNFILSSLDLYIAEFYMYESKELLNDNIISKTPELKFFISNENYNFSIKQEYYNIPINPPLDTKYGKLYLKMLDIYPEKIDIVILQKIEFDKLKKSTNRKNNIDILNIDYYNYNFIKQIGFKVSQGNYCFNDITTIIDKIIILNKYKQLPINFSVFFKGIEGDRNINGIPGKSGDRKNKVGKVRKINLNKLSKYIYFQEGDIIIAENTSVNYMKYIINSGGIITINSNNLSHASIVSRELGLPLILGVDELFIKLFDGDLIEMNSYMGTIKILKRFWE